MESREWQHGWCWVLTFFYLSFSLTKKIEKKKPFYPNWWFIDEIHDDDGFRPFEQFSVLRIFFHIRIVRSNWKLDVFPSVQTSIRKWQWSINDERGNPLPSWGSYFFFLNKNVFRSFLFIPHATRLSWLDLSMRAVSHLYRSATKR